MEIKHNKVHIRLDYKILWIFRKYFLNYNLKYDIYNQKSTFTERLLLFVVCSSKIEGAAPRETTLLVYIYFLIYHMRRLNNQSSSFIFKPRHSVYSTRRSQEDGVVLEVPHFFPSVYKLTNPFGLSYAYDAPNIWKVYAFSQSFSVALQFFLLILLLIFAFLYYAPGVCLEGRD